MLRTRLIAGPTVGFVMCAVFATVLTILNLGESLIEPLRVDPDRAAPVTIRIPPVTVVTGEDQLESETVSPVVGRGQRPADARTASLVRSYERNRRPPGAAHVLGLWVIYFLLAQLLTTYLRMFSPTRGALLRTQAALLVMLGVALLLAKLYLLFTDLSPLVIPIASMSLWSALYLDRRTAFIVTVGLSFFTASLLHFDLTAVAVYLATGLTAIALFQDKKRTIRMIPAGVIAGLAGAAVMIAAAMLLRGYFDPIADIMRGVRSELLAATAGGVIAGVLAFALQGLAVRAMGAVSRSRLLDLTDLDQKLLRKMAQEAPGSWEHSRAMANLAEAAAAAIGADALLTRVGAYYHDLGKTLQPKYFVENLEPGETSPHEFLEPDVSADAIMAHVIEGTRILRKAGIPEPVVEFAYTHHGTSVIEYFWHKCLEQGNPKELKESFFRYPGMRPRTKETAILMLIDSIEAAARTVEEPSREAFEDLVQRIFFVKLRQGQLDECGLTTRDIQILTTRITDTLCNVYHSRIKYPWQDRKERGEEPLPIPGVATEADVAREREQTQNEEDT